MQNKIEKEAKNIILLSHNKNNQIIDVLLSILIYQIKNYIII
jgi:hypothetical protein